MAKTMKVTVSSSTNIEENYHEAASEAETKNNPKSEIDEE